MSIKAVSVNCPGCGATVDVEEGRNQLFCSYCGNKIILDNSKEYIYRHIDEARVTEAETERLLELKKLEIMEKRRQEHAARLPRRIIASVILGLLGIAMMVCGFTLSDYNAGFALFPLLGFFPFIGIGCVWLGTGEDKDDLGFTVKVPAYDTYSNKNYITAKAAFNSMGFKNVSCIPLNDLISEKPVKNGKVETILINGERASSSGKKYPPDADVVITYHNVPERK